MSRDLEQPRRIGSTYNLRQFSVSEMNCDDLICEYQASMANNSILGIAGDDYAFIATSVPPLIDNEFALHRIGCRLLLASSGSQCHTTSFAALLRARLFLNESHRMKFMKPRCVAQLLSCLLTNHTVSDPMQNSYMIAGIDPLGKGILYAFDRLGYHETTPYRAMGNASEFLQTYLTETIRVKQRSPSSASNVDMNSDASRRRSRKSTKPPSIDFTEALNITIRAFQAAFRCGYYLTPQKVVISGITRDGICMEELCMF